MDIQQRVKLSQAPIHFFTEGLFVKLYNESYYAATQLLGVDLKYIVKYIKKIDQIIIYGGFPAADINRRFPKVQKTDYGYALLGSYNLSGYCAWQKQVIKQSKVVGNIKQIQQTVIPFSQINHINQEMIQNINISNKPLTPQQQLFLSLWQQGKYPQNLNDAFIQELKDYFGF